MRSANSSNDSAVCKPSEVGPGVASTYYSFDVSVEGRRSGGHSCDCATPCSKCVMRRNEPRSQSFFNPRPKPQGLVGGIRTMHVLSIVVLGAVGTLFTGCASDSARPASVSPLVSYSSPTRESLERLTIRRIAVDNFAAARITALSRTNSQCGSRWVACEPADTMRDGPWTTRLYIFDATDSHQCVAIEARDHASYGVSYEWLNDKLLFVRCWWGRIVSTDFVLDTETAHPLYIEDANYFRLVYDQTEK